jgi:opacity protein-like surface antigen
MTVRLNLLVSAAMLAVTAIGPAAASAWAQDQRASVQLIRGAGGSGGGGHGFGGGGRSGGGGGGYSPGGDDTDIYAYGFVCPYPYDICHPVPRPTQPSRTPAPA